LRENALCGVNRYGDGAFTLAAVEKLCEVLPKTRISTLDLAENRIKAEAGVKLAEAFKLTPNLTSVNLAENKIGRNGPEGAIALAEAFAKMPKLTSVE